MKKLFDYRFRVQSAFLLTGLCTVLLFGSPAFSEDAGESFTPSLLSSPVQEDQSALRTRLQSVRKDLEIFQTVAEHFTQTGETKTVGQLQGPVNDYLKRHADRLLSQARENPTPEITRLSAEVIITKARLFLSLNRVGDARGTLAELKRSYAPYQKFTVQSAGKSLTLDEAIRQLDEEIAKTAPVKKSQEVQ